MMQRISPLFLAAMLSGCTLIPDYVQPNFPAAEGWSAIPGYEQAQGTDQANALSWQTFFESPELKQVIQVALENNKDLRQAALNIEAARATYRISRADIFPNVNANGGASIQHMSDESSEAGRENTTETYQANIGLLSYELDLFGRIRSGNEAALNEYLATEQAHAVVHQALIAEVANAYLQLLADQKQLQLTEKTLAAQENTYGLLSESQSRGIASQQDVWRASTAVETARVNLHQYRRYVAQDQNALFLLLGVAQNNASLPVTTLDNIRVRDSLDPGIPSQVLLARPDVREAEYRLLARNADIGAARAAFFPSISLTGTYGLASQGLSDLFTSGALGAWSFLPQIALPIFSGGRNTANLDLAEIRKEQAILDYERAIQAAFREISDTLAARSTLNEQLEAQRRLVVATQSVYDISRARYDVGIESFLGVLDAQRELYAAEQGAINIERQRLSNLINLYKALGGGSAGNAPQADAEQSANETATP